MIAGLKSFRFVMAGPKILLIHVVKTTAFSAAKKEALEVQVSAYIGNCERNVGVSCLD